MWVPEPTPAAVPPNMWGDPMASTCAPQSWGEGGEQEFRIPRNFTLRPGGTTSRGEAGSS